MEIAVEWHQDSVSYLFSSFKLKKTLKICRAIDDDNVGNGNNYQ